MSSFRRRGITFHYEVLGEGEPFILLHGLGGSMKQLQDIFEPIDGIQYIFLDQRAHGKTDIITFQEMDFDVMADDVIALAEELGLTSFGIGGISMGAGVSVNLTTRFQERITHLLLIRNAWLAAPMEGYIIEWYQKLSEYLQSMDRTSFLQSQVLRDIRQISPNTADAFIKSFDEKASLQYPEKFRIMPCKQPFNTMDALKKIHVRTMILSNRQDVIHLFEYGEEYKKGMCNAVNFEIADKMVGFDLYKKDINHYFRELVKN